MVSVELLAESRAAFIDAFGFGRKTRCTENACDNFRYGALSGMPTSGQLVCENDSLIPVRAGSNAVWRTSSTEKARISMNLLRFRQAAAMVTALFLIPASVAQAPGGDKVDLDALAQIKTEAFQHSQVMENLFWMSEVYGPRVTNSRNHKARRRVGYEADARVGT